MRNACPQSFGGRLRWLGLRAPDGQLMAPDQPALAAFHPLVAEWFTRRFGAPTDVQAQSWPRIAAGEHLVITAPTGSGKTLTAFLWALNAFASGASQPGATRVLYISPLKALNNDIRRNLSEPMTALQALFESRGEPFPGLRANVRSGDTPPEERQRLLRRPPELLLTTPESLALMLSTVRGRHALASVETAVLDEIHAVVENRRGVSLATSLERLADIAGEFQRVALSATVKPLEAVARYVGGRRLKESGARAAALESRTARAAGLATEPRPVGVVQSTANKRLDFTVRFPPAARAAAENGQKIWEPLTDAFKALIAANRSTLLFANSRRIAEKVALKLNEGAAPPLAYAHHGSLSREIRAEVERRLKGGELKAIVATSSLEMGIDIGALDEVALIQSPPSIAATLQRIGRSGHDVGAVSRGVLFPTHGRDFLDAAALGEAVAERDIEPLRPMSNPLDVLAQIIVSATASESWRVDDLHALICRAAPYARLSRKQFDLVVEMLAGRYAGARVRDLQPRLSFDRLNQVIRAKKSAVLALYSAGGTIPDRGYFKLRHGETGAVIGELDEEFVWEATVGDAFALGTQSWRIHRITHNDVLVKPARSGAPAPPFWRAEAMDRSFHFAQRTGEFLERAEGWLAHERAATLRAYAQERLGFEQTAAEELAAFLQRQREATGCELPHRRHVLVEHIRSAPGGYAGADREQQAVLHTPWGGRVNRPIALALAAAWRERFGAALDVHADNYAIAAQIKDDIDPQALMALVTPANFRRLLRESVEASGFFGARFRECAGRSLLLTRQRFNQRLPLWLTRMQAKKLMVAVARLEDFPVLLETWRTCLQDEFDLGAAEQALADLESGAVAWSLATVATPSPFAADIAFSQIGSRYMYADDTPETRERSALSDDLLRQAVYDSALRPRIAPAVAAEFEAKAQRTASGYAPRDADALADWVKERVAIPADEFAALLAASGLERPAAVARLRRGRRVWFAHREDEAHLRRELLGEKAPAPAPADARDARQLFLEFARFYGPRSEAEWAERFPLPREALVKLLAATVTAEACVEGLLIDGACAPQFCDAQNLETLMRFQRAAKRPPFEPRSVRLLPCYLAAWHRLGAAASETNLLDAADRLRGYRAPLPFWLEDAWRARLDGFSTQLLDAACMNAGLTWRGAGKEQAAFGFEGEIDDMNARPTPPSDGIQRLFADPAARYTFAQLMDASGEDAQAFNRRFWQAVWNGELGADGPQPLAAGLARRFKLDAAAAGGSVARARSRARRAAQGWPGNWFLIAAAPAPEHALERLESAKERCRALLDRYGVVCRELANREGEGFRWAAVFPALRIMELAGEVTAGLFFAELSGPQFAQPLALRQLERLTPAGAAFWVSALDPVSPAGLGLDWDGLPQRRAGNYLGFHAGKLAATMEGGGKRLRIFPPPDDPALDALLARLPLGAGGRRVALETINGEAARHSPHLPALARNWPLMRDHRSVYLQREVGRGL